jgi:hypothetical protein
MTLFLLFGKRNALDMCVKDIGSGPALRWVGAHLAAPGSVKLENARRRESDLHQLLPRPSISTYRSALSIIESGEAS